MQAQHPPHRTAPATAPRAPNAPDYARACATFSWQREQASLQDASGKLNLAWLAAERHAGCPRAALRWRGPKQERIALSYGELAEASGRLARRFRDLGVEAGTVVATLAERRPEVYLSALAAWKLGAIFCPLLADLGPEPLRHRLSTGGVYLLVTHQRLKTQRLAALRDTLPRLRHVLLLDGDSEPDVSLPRLLASSDPPLAALPLDPQHPATLHFTSGTTGLPKSAVHAHQVVAQLYATGRDVLDFQSGDIYLCTADPGWVTGTAYGLIAPLVHGLTLVADGEPFDPARLYRLLEEEQATILYTAPTVLRRLMRLGGEPRRSHDLSRLRLIFSVGEPLNPEAIRWSEQTLGLPVHDTWWQTETGGIAIANLPALPIRPGSMGVPAPGMQAALVQRAGSRLKLIEAPGQVGEIALRAPWPGLYRPLTAAGPQLVQGWYLSGDLASRDAEGRYWFAGRADDMIKTSGHQVSPFEVESALMEHPAVVEAAAVGLPDPVIGQRVVAFVVLRRGWRAGEELAAELLGFGRSRLGALAAPRQIRFRRQLPKNRAGKILRRRLRAQGKSGE